MLIIPVYGDIAGCILGPVEEGWFHRCRHQARHSVRAGGGAADELLAPGLLAAA